MTHIISKEDIRKGDKIKVTFVQGDVENTKTGVVEEYNGRYDDWKTSGDMFLCVDIQNAVIELLERPKSAEEILAERRDAVAAEITTGWFYASLATPLKTAIDKIIELEDKLAEKEEN